jgi:hypothetical protein
VSTVSITKLLQRLAVEPVVDAVRVVSPEAGDAIFAEADCRLRRVEAILDRIPITFTSEAAIRRRANTRSNSASRPLTTG